jgi:hypothetical protein
MFVIRPTFNDVVPAQDLANLLSPRLPFLSFLPFLLAAASSRDADESRVLTLRR